jgi:hypothetical protein
MAVFSNTEIADHSGLGSVLLSFAEESAIQLSNEAGSHLPLYVAVAYYFYDYRKFLASLFFGSCQPPEEVLDYARSLKVTLLELQPGEHEKSELKVVIYKSHHPVALTTGILMWQIAPCTDNLSYLCKQVLTYVRKVLRIEERL